MTNETLNQTQYNLIIKHDEFPENPREWDNLGTMIFFHKRYNLGDKHNYDIEELNTMVNSSAYISLPVYMIDHSGISISTSPFSCPWDSGKLGYIILEKKKAYKEFNCKRISKKLLTKIKEYLNNEVKIYDDYIQGNVYNYEILDNEGNEIDSCNGFIGDNIKENGMLEHIPNNYHYLITSNNCYDYLD